MVCSPVPVVCPPSILRRSQDGPGFWLSRHVAQQQDHQRGSVSVQCSRAGSPRLSTERGAAPHAYFPYPSAIRHAKVDAGGRGSVSTSPHGMRRRRRRTAQSGCPWEPTEGPSRSALKRHRAWMVRGIWERTGKRGGAGGGTATTIVVAVVSPEGGTEDTNGDQLRVAWIQHPSRDSWPHGLRLSSVGVVVSVGDGCLAYLGASLGKYPLPSGSTQGTCTATPIFGWRLASGASRRPSPGRPSAPTRPGQGAQLAPSL